MPVGLEDDTHADGLGYESLAGSPPTQRRKSIIGAIIVLVLLALIVGVVIAVVATNAQGDDSGENDENGTNVAPVPNVAGSLADQMVAARLMGHLGALFDIAMRFNGSRAVEFGYNASADYIKEILEQQAPSFIVRQEFFQVDMYEAIVPPTLNVTSPFQVALRTRQEFIAFRGFSGSKIDVQRQVEVPSDAFGCNVSDFANFSEFRIALIKRGACTFQEKVDAAFAANASAVIIYNDGESEDRFGPVNGALTAQPIPTFGIGFTTGLLFAQVQPTVHMAEHTRSYKVTTSNIIADTPGGDPTAVIVVGSHLDSVPAGPGINDNGSGSAVNLELAIQIHALLAAGTVTLKNRIRFAWWGAEEIGLLGSTFYVNNLTQADLNGLKDIAMNLNYDMLGSPNYFYGVYDGKNAEQEAIRNASGKIQQVYTEFFDAEGLSWDPTPFDGRSDYGPFIAALIPAGGLFSGAEAPKTMEQRKLVGGLADAAYDPCYHAECDSIENIDQVGYMFMARAAASALQTAFEQPSLREWLAAGPTN